MASPKPSFEVTARTIRFPEALRKRIATDAERCGRSFEAQVLALLRNHYGENVDIAPQAKRIVKMAVASLAGIPKTERRLIERRLRKVE
ncbi:MAG: hypothetical protein QOI66_1635 [Myxococcales bacterium]|nr:hypothetical protein [Myxococcales bacterium]